VKLLEGKMSNDNEPKSNETHHHVWQDEQQKSKKRKGKHKKSRIRGNTSFKCNNMRWCVIYVSSMTRKAISFLFTRLVAFSPRWVSLIVMCYFNRLSTSFISYIIPFGAILWMSISLFYCLYNTNGLIRWFWGVLWYDWNVVIFEKYMWMLWGEIWFVVIILCVQVRDCVFIVIMYTLRIFCICIYCFCLSCE